MSKEDKIQRTYKFRLYPSKHQELILLEHIDLCRQIYNTLLQELNNQKIINKSVLSALIPDLKICYPKLNKVYSKALQPECNKLFGNINTLSKLKKKGKKVGKLRYKSKNSFKSITYNQSGFKFIQTEKRLQKLKLSKIGEIPIRAHREIKGKIKQITIKKTSSGKLFANLNCEIDKEKIKQISSNGQIGIDLGLINYIYDSNGCHVNNPKFLNKSLDKLKKEQKKLSSKQKESKNRNKQRIKISKIYEKIENQREDFLHKLSRLYVNKYDLIAIENLQIQNMIQNKYLSKSISDSSWAKFIQMLEYKAERAGVQVIKVDPRRTSQECSNCKQFVKKKLEDRDHICGCGLNINRDYNSAINILKKATVGSTESNAWGNVSIEMSKNQESIL